MPKDTSKLYNHSERHSLNHQISTSSGSTLTGHHHVVYSSTSINVPHLPSPHPGDMDIDYNPIDNEPIVDEAFPQIQTAIPELPGLTIIAKARAKRYDNSVTLSLMFILTLTTFIIVNRTFL